MCLRPLRRVIYHIDGFAGAEVACDGVLAGEGVDGEDVGELQSGDLDGYVRAEVGGVGWKRPV